MSSRRRWYWAVSCDHTVSDPFVGDDGDLGLDESLVRCGEAINGWPESAWVRASHAESDGEPDDVLQTLFGVPIFSSRLRSALDLHTIGGLQYLAIRIVGFDNRDIDGFTVANILNCVDALDRAKSDYGVFPPDYFVASRVGQIRSINRPVLIRSMLRGVDIVRLKPYRASVYVSDRFVQLFEDGEYTGYSFHEVETTS
jgi:hypothetical protein